MMKLYVIGQSEFAKQQIPEYELFAAYNDVLTYLGSGPRLNVEQIKKLITLLPDSEVIELKNISNNTFTQIMMSCGFEIK